MRSANPEPTNKASDLTLVEREAGNMLADNTSTLDEFSPHYYGWRVVLAPVSA